MNPSPSSTEAIAHAQNGALHTHMNQYRTVAPESTSVPIRNDARRPTVSATTPVGTSKTTIPSVKNAFAANASRLVSPASSRKSVLTPQMNEAASVLPAVSTRKMRWMRRAAGVIVEAVATAPAYARPATSPPDPTGASMWSMVHAPEVDSWFESYQNPQKALVLAVRDAVLDAHPGVTETIKWQAPTFVYNGNIASFYPKAKKTVTLMFHTGASIPDPDGLLEGDGDVSRVARFARRSRLRRQAGRAAERRARLGDPARVAPSQWRGPGRECDR